MSDDMSPHNGDNAEDEIDPELTNRLREVLLVDGERRPPAEAVERIRAAAMARQQESDDARDVANDDTWMVSSASDLSQGEVWSRRPLMLAAAAAVIVGLAVGALAVASFGAKTPVEEALADGVVEYTGELRGEPGEAHLEVVRTGVGRVISIATDDLAILPKSEFYEVWFVGAVDADGGEPPRISVGTFHPDANGVSNVILTGAVDPNVLPVVEITAEPGDGDPRPGGPVVLSVTIDPIG